MSVSLYLSVNSASLSLFTYVTLRLTYLLYFSLFNLFSLSFCSQICLLICDCLSVCFYPFNLASLYLSTSYSIPMFNFRYLCVTHFSFHSLSLSVSFSLCSSVFLFFCLSVSLSLCLSVSLSLCLSVSLSLCLSVYISLCFFVFLFMFVYFSVKRLFSHCLFVPMLIIRNSYWSVTKKNDKKGNFLRLYFLLWLSSLLLNWKSIFYQNKLLQYLLFTNKLLITGHFY